ncbi:MAG: energy transducer TonB [Candidatus Obscuribacter sp.]|nr:energy transducer TonB [Candidatus Obscuribacter sp.]
MKRAILFVSTCILMICGPPGMCDNKNLKNEISGEYFKAYVIDVEKRLNRMSYPVRTEAPKGTQAIITFQIEESGDVNNIKLAASSGNKNFDEACLLDVENRAPFRPFLRKLSVKAVYEPLKTEVTVKPDQVEKKSP